MPSIRLAEPAKYPPETAGRLMVEHVPLTYIDFTIKDAKKIFFQNLPFYQSINYIYVVDKNHVLRGVISLKEFLREPENIPIANLISPPIFVHPYTDQEKVAYLALKNNIKAVPVVDKNHKFLGIVPNDTILQITFTEAQEDLLRFAGIHHFKSITDNIMHLSVRTSLMHRLPWLVIGLIGGLISAYVVKNYESTLKENLILAAFIPLVVYTASAVGAQMQAFFIRDGVLHPDIKFNLYIKKQLHITALIAFIISLSLALITLGIHQQLIISIILGVTLFASITSSLFTGVLIPYLFSHFKLDPANGSGPIGTIIQDLLSLTIYLLISTWLISL